MDILYDGLTYSGQVAGGISRYFSNLIHRLPQDFQPTLTSCHSNNLNYPLHPNLKTFSYKRFAFRPGRVAYWLEKYHFRAIENRNQFDLAHPTYYSLLTRRDVDCYRCPVVITVHDMIHEIFAEQIDINGEHAELKRKAILAAQAIVCVSENTKKDLLERLPIPEERITVTYLASQIKAEMSHGSEPVPSRPYFLYIGTRCTYKNFDCLLQALSKITSTHPDVMIGVVGSPFDIIEQQRITDLRLNNHIEHYGHISDTHLAKLYRCSIAFVYPSHYEGFGIPPLEAMSCGTAVIASNASSIPEVVGDAGLLFDSKTVHDLVDRLLFLIDHPAERDRLIAKGFEQAKNFSWDKTASQTLKVYCSVAA
jgi:glycosyltransferase involved in cell wall biosynthesis